MKSFYILGLSSLFATIDQMSIPLKINYLGLECSQKVTKSEIDKYNGMKEEITSIIANSDDFKFSEDLYNRALEIFHPYDEYFSEFLNLCLYEYIEAENYAKCLEITKMKLIYLNQHLNSYEMNIGGQKIQTAKFCIQLGKY